MESSEVCLLVDSDGGYTRIDCEVANDDAMYEFVSFTVRHDKKIFIYRAIY